MKSLHVALVILCVSLTKPALAQQAGLPVADRLSTSSATAAQEESPAQQRIAGAQLQIKADPKKVQAYNELAIGFLRRARETADRTYLKDADAALAEGLKLDATDFQLQKTQVALMLSRHEFVQARERATALHRHTPDDVMTYGYLAEANIALGNYQEAETNAQWMMNLRPNNTPALLAGATLRTIFGDAHGAIDFLNRAYSQTSPIEVEDLAWIANQIASIQVDSGQDDAAEQTLQQAEQIFPCYPYTMENLARMRMSQDRANDAIQLWTQASRIDRDPHLLYELARAQEAAGRGSEARGTYVEFERLAGAQETATDRSKLDLILMYAGSLATASDALVLAQKEIAQRQDVWTLDAYAWALYANGKYQDADGAEQKAIAVGIQSAQIFDHAGHIAQRLNHGADAMKYFQLSVQTNASSEFSADARRSGGLNTNADAGAENHDHNAALLEPAAPVSQISARQSSSIVADQPDHLAAPVSVAITTVAPVFAPVPDALLTPQPTGTNHLIKAAQAAVAGNPKDAQGYAELGAAYFQRARETGDVSDYQLAGESLNKSLDLVSADFSADAALGTMAEVCMGEHRFAYALGYAQKALSLGTGDVSPFATVGDAYADMGEYDKAGVAYGRLTPRDMTLSPRAAYARDSRLSYLKFIAGDTRAAIVLMKTAVTEGLDAQLPSENLAWLYYELGEYETQVGDAASADAAYLAALNTHPGDYRALAALARLRADNGRYTEAILLYQKAIAVVPMPTFIAELGDLYARQGNHEEAQKQYALVEYIGLLGHINQVLHNRDLALFYADHDMKLAESLDLAQKELEVRCDIYTWDALAWALYKNGKLTDAARASEKAMRFGTRDSLLLFHAAMIADGMGQREQARKELSESLEINPHFHLIYAGVAKQKLLALEPQFASKGGSNARLR
jgi:tetratricopeptide (TPR) repeat protein